MLRLGILELSVLGLVVGFNGYLDYSRLLSELRGVYYVTNVNRSCKSLASKKLVRLHCSGSGRIQGVEINLKGLTAAFIGKTKLGKKLV